VGQLDFLVDEVVVVSNDSRVWTEGVIPLFGHLQVFQKQALLERLVCEFGIVAIADRVETQVELLTALRSVAVFAVVVARAWLDPHLGIQLRPLNLELLHKVVWVLHFVKGVIHVFDVAKLEKRRVVNLVLDVRLE